ncbi:hypothetical protein G6F46_015365 [Rhizopus delemar]|nr:hypothetical protein G6F46_015365 [Rhizopus delemar]
MIQTLSWFWRFMPAPRITRPSSSSVSIMRTLALGLLPIRDSRLMPKPGLRFPPAGRLGLEGGFELSDDVDHVAGRHFLNGAGAPLLHNSIELAVVEVVAIGRKVG